MPSVYEKISQYNLGTIKVKSLSELRQSSQNPSSTDNGEKQEKEKMLLDPIDSSKLAVTTGGSMFKLERVLGEASMQARGIQKEAILPFHSATDIQQSQSHKMKNGRPISQSLIGKQYVSSNVFSADQVSSSESIFSPTFNPMLSNVADHTMAPENGGQALKFSFGSEILSKQGPSASTAFASKGLRVNKLSQHSHTRKKTKPQAQTLNAVIKTPTTAELVAPLHDKHMKLKRSSSRKMKEDMPEPKKVKLYAIQFASSFFVCVAVL